jgi:peptidoglycan/LPS O-acetylase OafA/YrhL
MISLATWLAAAAWSVLAVTAQFDDRANHVWRSTFMAATTALLIFAAIRAPDGGAIRGSASPDLAGVGRISYGLYLWHYPIFLVLHRHLALPLAMTLFAGTALSFGAAFVSYRLVELPALRFKQRWQ